MKKAVHFGAGNIGRGFIGLLLSQAGYHVSFVDVAAPLVDDINSLGKYNVQIWGQEPVELIPGVVFTVPEGVKHWHGAAPGKMMQHLSIMQSNSEVSTEWLEPVDDKFFNKLK